MPSQTNERLDIAAGGALKDGNSPFAGKANHCAKVLAEAQRLVRIDPLGAPLKQLVFRACELLDDMDEVLVALHPVRDRGSFVMAATLHRKLEQIQAAIPAPSRASS